MYLCLSFLLFVSTCACRERWHKEKCHTALKVIQNAKAHLILLRSIVSFHNLRDSQAVAIDLQRFPHGPETFSAVATLRVQDRNVGPAEGHQNICYSQGLRSE